MLKKMLNSFFAEKQEDAMKWAFAIVFLWALAATLFVFFRNPLPFPDRGHRCFAVKNQEAARAVVWILDRLGGLPERFTFDAGPTHQTVLWDNETVILYHDQTIRDQGLPPNALSVAVDDPRDRAIAAAARLREAGFRADVIQDIIPEAGGKFVLVTSDAFEGWGLAFRRHILAMGKPPNQRKLLE
jgi:hypothetical protein